MAMTYRAPASTAGLLSTNDRNRLLNNFAGGLLTGFQVNPTPVDGRYLTMTNTPFDVVDPVPDQSGPMTMDDFARLMEQYRNQQNLMNESGQADDFDVGSGTYDGSFLDFVTDPNGFWSILDAPVGLIGLARGAMNAYQDATGQYFDGYEYTGHSDGDELGEGQFDDFDADMQAEE